MTTDLLGLGKTGLRAAQVQLEVTGSNVANADTPGYARRTALQVAESAGSRGYPEYTEFGGGIGVRVAGISRGYDRFLTEDVRTTAGLAADSGAKADWLGRIESALGTRDSGISAAMSGFLDSAEGLAASPNSRPLRSEFLARIDALAASFRDTSNRLSQIDQGVSESLQDTLGNVNRTLESIEDINRQLARTRPGTAASTVLLDRRDAALDTLSAGLPISTEYLPQGRVRVRLDLPDGDELVAPGKRSSLALGETGADGLPVLRIDANFAPRAIAVPSGGKVGGLFSALASVRAQTGELNQFAVNTAYIVNAQHQAGVDQTGAAGFSLFTSKDGTLVAGAADIFAADLNPDNIAAAAAFLPDGVTPTPAGREDNRNLLALGIAVSDTLVPRLTAMRGDISSRFAAARDRADIAQISAGDAQTARANALGVNLDEEAANLIRYQQSYEAAARIIATARDTFDTLLNIR